MTTRQPPPRRPARPAIHLNCALTARGTLGSGMISCPADWRRVHQLREEHEAVSVGARTWLADEPRLTARPDRLGRAPRRQPDVVVFAGTHLCTVKPDGRRVFVIGAHPPGAAGAIAILAGDHDLVGPLSALHGHGVGSLLVEGGPTLLRSFLEQGLVDRFTIFVRSSRAADAGRALRSALSRWAQRRPHAEGPDAGAPEAPLAFTEEPFGEGFLFASGPSHRPRVAAPRSAE